MRNALISPNEKVYDADGNLLGDRVAEVSENSFPIAPPLFWVECADDVVADQFYYANGAIIKIIELDDVSGSVTE